jgi:hypothetical protein
MKEHTFFFKAEANGLLSWSKTLTLSGIVSASSGADAYAAVLEQVRAMLEKQDKYYSLDNAIISVLNRLD